MAWNNSYYFSKRTGKELRIQTLKFDARKCWSFAWEQFRAMACLLFMPNIRPSLAHGPASFLVKQSAWGRAATLCWILTMSQQLQVGLVIVLCRVWGQWHRDDARSRGSPHHQEDPTTCPPLEPQVGWGQPEVKWVAAYSQGYTTGIVHPRTFLGTPVLKASILFHSWHHHKVSERTYNNIVVGSLVSAPQNSQMWFHGVSTVTVVRFLKPTLYWSTEGKKHALQALKMSELHT